MLILRGLIGTAVQVALIGAALLLPAGTWNWPRAIQFLVGYGVIVALSVIIFAKVAPESLEARLVAPASASQPRGDRIASALLITALSVWLVFIPVDVFRLQLLSPPSLAMSTGGAVVCVAGLLIILTTIYQNAFATPIVKDQSDRGQTLVDTGLYSRIRHPMYSGVLLWLAGLALWLESIAAAMGVIGILPFLLLRIHGEERFLRGTLGGYGDYMERVRHRLIPFVW
jgi:protein-S-isoprenylcysteine O-methyltransferase Ste14